MDQDTSNANHEPQSEDERELIANYRRCSPRRKDVVKRFARKLAGLHSPLVITRQVVTNILPFPFKRRKDDS